jgi:predicted nucleotidyltransferase
LSSEQQAAVKEFINYLKEQSPQAPDEDFRKALEAFIHDHPELLRRLAQ